MIAGQSGLCDAGGAVCIEAGQQDRGFYLGGSHFCRIMDAVEGLSLNVQGSAAVPVKACDGCAHLRQRFDDALHGPFLNRGVSCQSGFKALAAYKYPKSAGW